MTQEENHVSFEDAMSRLEQIVMQLEKGDLPLDEALDAFQKGIKLSQYCQHKLQEADQLIVNLMTQQGKQEFKEVK